MENELENWEEFISGAFLKAADVTTNDDAYVCVGIERILRDDKPQIRLQLQRNETQTDFDLNKTNATKLKELGLKAPSEVVGKKIYFRKVLVRNPKTNQEVESLRIWKIE